MKYSATEFANSPLYGLPLVVFDFETTGVDPQECRAVELAVVHVELGKGNEEVVYCERFNPEIPIPQEASQVHGIYTKDVEDSKRIRDCWQEILPLFEGRVLAGYNLAYDWQILCNEYVRTYGLSKGSISSPFGSNLYGICGYVIAKFLDTEAMGGGYHTLARVCERREIYLENAHSAYADTLATAQVLDQLFRELAYRMGKFPTMRDFWAWEKCQGIHQEQGLRNYLRGRGIENRIWPWTDY